MRQKKRGIKIANYNDFDLDLKMASENGAKSADLTGITISTKCPINVSQAFKCTIGSVCAMPTKDRPAASCHKRMAGAVQARC
ncbi:hypothetical protein [Clostridium sp. UBA6640]|uniref:hypothetical protein n=1 Tax=Clostridium sp. UBA6640 TaxID=1946370 RepID=UPI0025BCE0B4|nr:hypothetical protein [Clostridium sp. UBA6640]